ncbi:MAG: hypothetical protein ACXIUV_04205 [Alkalilacustris sp.]
MAGSPVPTRALLGALLGLLLAAPAAAGPWGRDPGAAFAAFTLGAEDSDLGRRGHAQAFAERGLGGDRVASARLRLDGPLGAEGRGDAEAEVRLRWHPGWTDAVALGVEGGLKGETGATRSDGTRGTAGFALTALHVGRGLQTPWGAGWTRLSLIAQTPLTAPARSRREALVQMGLRTPEGWIGLASLSVFEEAGSRTLKLTPALGRSLAPGRDLLLELTVERGGSGTRGLALAFWQAF